MEKFDKKEQAVGLLLCIAVSVEIVAPAYSLFKLLRDPANDVSKSVFTTSILLLTVCLGGFLGGAVRALNRLLVQLNDDDPQVVAAHLSRWFMYLAKPFIGVGGGLAFFIVTNMGLLTGPSLDQVGFNPFGVILISFIGGMFFEDVFLRLQRIIKGPNSKQTED